MLGATVVGWAFSAAKAVNAAGETLGASVRIVRSKAGLLISNTGTIVAAERSAWVPATFEGRAVLLELSA